MTSLLNFIKNLLLGSEVITGANKRTDISGFHGGEYEDYRFLGYSAV
jgi:hypothetical protein